MAVNKKHLKKPGTSRHIDYIKNVTLVQGKICKIQ